ncbi:MAG: phosphate propanoyltransferase [Ruminococcaceae bacterium]|nr:phosphate propanoyltransferase [Oscillospiraceae bacterium]
MAEKFLVETSARHVHVTKATLEALFGAGKTLTNKKDLSQPGQFACEEKVTVVGPKGELKCSILGPERKADQVELSLTDARTIGVSAAVRESGDIAGTDGCILRGPCGEVKIENGIIAAKRHIHMTPADAATYGVSDKEIVSVKIDDCKRPLIFGDVVVRVSENFALAMHIDTDECNAAGISGNASGEIVK